MKNMRAASIVTTHAARDAHGSQIFILPPGRNCELSVYFLSVKKIHFL